MGRFENSIVTLSGVDMLNEQLIGRKMTVTSVCTGSGMTDVSELEKITELQDQKQKGRLVSLEDADTYKRIRIQLSNSGLGESYQLHQVLVMAALDEPAVPGGYQEQSFVVMQDDVGINVPSEEDAPGWELEMYCVIALDNKLHIDIVVDPAGTAKLKDLDMAMARHNADTEAHPSLRPVTVELTVPAEAWQEDESGGDYGFSAVVDCVDAAVSNVPIVTLDKASLKAAGDAGLCPTVEALDGSLHLWATAKPASELTGWVTLLGPGSGAGGGGISLPVATEDILGGIKASDSLTVDPDGTAHSKVDFATDQEVLDMLREVFDQQD